MQINLIGQKRTVIAKIPPELDHHFALEIRKSIDAKIKSSNAVNIIFDFSDVDFMDSSGIGLIMGRYKITNILGGKLILCGAKSHILRIIEMSGINKLIKICNSPDEAIRLI